VTEARPGGADPGVAGFVPALRVSDLAPGKMRFVAVDRERVLVANVGGTFYAIEDLCGHRRESLSKGTLFGYVVECPLHFACFDVRSGKFISGPASADVPAREVLVEGDTVYIKK
jgi:3-phenylpropionate/trans-cinnamate dioxygenase ferredoxin subunit